MPSARGERELRDHTNVEPNLFAAGSGLARHRLAINVRRQDDTLVSAAVFWRLRFDGWAVHVRPVLLYEFSYCSRSLAGLRRRVLDASLHFQS